MTPTYTHRAAEVAIDAAFRSRARGFVFADLLFVISLLAASLLSLFFLVASVPLVVLYLARAGSMASFLWRHRRRPLGAARMYTTVPAHGTHLRRSANLSLYPVLHAWYLATLAVTLPAPAWAFVALFVMVALGAFPFVVYAGLVALVFLSYWYARGSHVRFYERCVAEPVEDQFPTPHCQREYAASRAAQRRDKMLYDMDLYFHQREAVAKIPAANSPASQRRPATRGHDARRSRRAGAHNDRHRRQDRKKSHNK